MAREVRFGVRLTGDAKGAVNAMHMTDRELKRLGREMRKTDRSVRSSRREWSQWGNGILSVRRLLGPLAGIGGVSVLARTTRNVVENTAALSEAADVGGVTAETYQELTKAFSDLGGVSDNVTGGALRRFNRRLGLADQGTGAAKDTFEELGIAIRGLDGDMRMTDDVLRQTLERLGEIENGAERAAYASQVFGEDAGPRLAAVLGQGTEALTDHIAKLREQGRVLDNETVASARAANDQLNEMRDIISTRFNQQILDNADSYMRMAEGLATVAEKGLEALSVLSDISKWAGEEVAARTGGIAGDDIVRLEQERDRITEMMEGGLVGHGRRVRFFGRDGLVSYYSEDELRQELARIDAQIAQHYAQAAAPGTPQERTPRLDPVQVVGTPDDAGGTAATPSDPGPSRFLTDEIDRQVELMREQITLYRELEAEGRSVYENTRTPLEQLNTEMARLDELLDAGVISWDTYARAVFDAEERLGGLAETTREEMGRMDGYSRQAARSMQQNLAQFLFDPWEEGLQGMLKGFGQMLQQMIAEAVAADIMGALSGSGGGNAAGLFQGIAGLFGASFAGGGHTGNAPRVGGIDGQGGFPAILHPRETVVDHTAAARQVPAPAPPQVNQQIIVQGRPDSRTARQIAGESARKQRQVQARYGA